MGKLGKNQLKIWNKHVSKWLGTHHLALEILRDSWRRIGMTGVMNRYEYCAKSFGNSNSHIDTIATIVSGSCWQQAARRIWTYTSQSLVLMLQVETYLSSSYIFFCHMLGILWCLFGTAVLLMLDTLKLWDDDPGAPMAPFCSGRRLATRMARTSPTRSTTTPAPASALRRIPQWNAWSSASRISDVWTFWGWDLLTHGGRLERSDFWRSPALFVSHFGFESGDPQPRALRIRPRTSWAHAAADFHPRRPPWLQALYRHTWPKWGPSFGTTTTSTRRFYVDKLPLPGKLEMH